MAMGDWTVGDAAILEGSSSTTLDIPSLSYWITINNTINYAVKVGSISCERVLNGKSSLSFILSNPTTLPICGQAVKFIIASKLYFGGVIQTVTLNAPADEAVKEYTVDCAGWEAWLEKHLVKSSYSNQTTYQLLGFVMSDANLSADGFSLGYRDNGAIMELIDADYVRASEYLRDIASAGGGAIEIGAEKEISFHTTSFEESPFDLTVAEPEYVQTAEDLDNYCNSMTVRVTGVSGNVTTTTRTDPAEISQRQVVEGGSGVYESFVQLDHPTLDDTASLARFGISMAFLFMQSRSRVNKPITARLRRTQLDVGQLIAVNVPGMNAIGDYQISRMNISDDEGQIAYEIEATFTSRRQLNLESLLRVVQAGKTSILIPTDDFGNTVTFSAGTTWNVPGAGTVQVEVDTLGAGGGGGGGTNVFSAALTGGSGGAGGKAISFREYAAGTTLTIVVGTGGAGGAGSGGAGDGSTGGTGGSSYVSSPTEAKVAEGLGGAGGGGAHGVVGTPPPGVNGSAGADGGATGDYPFVGGGSPGGPGGYTEAGAGAAGTNGKVIIRY